LSSGAYEQVLPVFLEAPEDNYDEDAVVDCLAQSGDPRAIAALVRAGLTSEIENVGSTCRSALRKLGAGAAPAIRAAVPNADGLALAKAIRLLREIHDESDFSLFIDATRHEDGEVRKSAVCALDDNRANEALPALLDRLDDDFEDIPRFAVQGLGIIGDPRAVPRLIDCLEDDELAQYAADALEAIGTQEARAARKVWINRAKE
jgi:HEAT repeat protein